MSIRETVVDALVRTLDVENRRMGAPMSAVATVLQAAREIDANAPQSLAQIEAAVKEYRAQTITQDQFVERVCKAIEKCG